MKKHISRFLFLISSLMPVISHAANVQPFVDLLAWHAYESSASWATTLSFPGNTTNFTPNYIDFNTRLGMKAGLTYSPDNFWDTTLYWTYFQASTSKSIPVGSEIVTSLFFSGSELISHDVFFAGNINWQLNLNMLDLTASHAFKPTPSFTLSPKIGVKGGSIDQDITAHWNALVYTATENLTNHFTGAGPSFGLNAKWNFYQDISLVGDVSTALMYGKWNVKDAYYRPEFTLIFIPIPSQTIVTSMNQSKLGVMMMDYYLGLEWIHKGQSQVTVKLGYEMQYWANQLRLITINQLPTLGDLTIEGATCGISIDL